MLSETNKLMASKSLDYCNALLVDTTKWTGGDTFLLIYCFVIFIILVAAMIFFVFKADSYKRFIENKKLQTEYTTWKKNRL